jgi:hypothetical protein
LLVGADVHPADAQDRDGAKLVIEAVHQLFPWLRHLFADSVYNGPNLRDALAKIRETAYFEVFCLVGAVDAVREHAPWERTAAK